MKTIFQDSFFRTSTSPVSVQHHRSLARDFVVQGVFLGKLSVFIIIDHLLPYTALKQELAVNSCMTLEFKKQQVRFTKSMRKIQSLGKLSLPKN